MFKTTLKVLPAAILLASCAQPQNRMSDLKIEPVQEVQHSYNQARAQYQLGRYYHGQMRFREAEQAYHKALASDPGMVDAWNALGTVYAELGDLPQARAMFERALKHDALSAYTYNNLGYAYYLEGNNEAAAAAFKQALHLEGDSQKAKQNLVLVYSRMGMENQIASTEPAPAAVEQTTATQVATAAEPAAQAPVVAEAPTAKWVQVSPSVYEALPKPAPTQQTARAEPATPTATPALALAEFKPAPSQPQPAQAKPAAPIAATVVVAEAAAAPPAITATPTPTATPKLALAMTYTQPPAKAQAVRTAVTSAPAIETILRRGGTEVSNGNGIRGFAARIARFFSSFGIAKSRLTNDKPFVVKRTRIEYRPGSEAEAAQLNALLPKAVPHVASNKLRSDIRVRLVLGHDLRRQEILAWEERLGGVRKVAAVPEGLKLPQI